MGCAEMGLWHFLRITGPQGNLGIQGPTGGQGTEGGGYSATSSPQDTSPHSSRVTYTCMLMYILVAQLVKNLPAM